MKFSAVTFNLRINVKSDGNNAWPYRKEQAAKLVRNLDPVVMGTQEGSGPMLLELAEQLPEYGWIGQGRSGESSDEHCAIFYKREVVGIMDQGQFWLSENPLEPNSSSWESALPRICTWAHFQFLKDLKKEFILYNTHLDHRSELAREKGMEVIWQAITRKRSEKNVPILLMGDLNSKPDSLVVRFLHGRALLGSYRSNLMDAYSSLNRQSGAATFHGFNGGTEGEPIDYIFVSPGIAIDDAGIYFDKIDGRFPSDHYPVFARLLL